MWVWIVIGVLLLVLVCGRSRESFYIENNVPEGIKYIKIVNTPYVKEDGSLVDTVMGWSGAGHDNPGDKNQTEESCRAKAAANPEKYVAWGFRMDTHPDPNYRKTCFLYRKGEFGRFRGNPMDNVHVTGCVNPGEKVANACNLGDVIGDRYLQISQLAAFDMNGVNVAKGQPVTATPPLSGSGAASIAVDGNLVARNYPNFIYHSESTKGNEFWQVELKEPTTLSRIEYYNRLDCCQYRARNYILLLLGSGGELLASIPFQSSSQSMTFYLNKMDGVEGIEGPKGDKGEKGDQGLKGDPGPAGPAGSAGAPGGQGVAGPTGEKGPKGDKGDQGPMGQDALEEGADGTYAHTVLGSSKYGELT